MHIYFSGIGGAAIGPLALIAKKAGYTVSGSDKQQSSYLDYLKQRGVTDIHVGQSYEQIAAVHKREPIDWFVYTSALPVEQPDALELRFCQEHDIRTSKRDGFLTFLIEQRGLKLLAVAGTHGKTTTTAMVVWLFRQLAMPLSYSVGAKLDFGDMGEFDPASEYFVYEADEFDRNFLSFHPQVALITGIDWDHPDIYPTKQAYDDAFRTFISQSKRSYLWSSDAKQLVLEPSEARIVLDETDSRIDTSTTLPGHVNRLDAWQVAQAMHHITNRPATDLLEQLDRFPGVSRRFEPLAAGLYSDYAHTPPKIRGVLQLAREVAGNNVVVLYEGLHNTRQHFIKHELKTIFDDVKQLYIVPSYLAREDPSLTVLSPEHLIELLSTETQAHAQPAQLDNKLMQLVRSHIQHGDTVLALSAGGGGSLDEWLRAAFQAKH